MHSEAAAAALRDILHNLELAERFVAGMDFVTFQGDTRTLYAVIRCLEVISEASRRVPEEVKSRHAAIPWKNIAGAGNIYRHEYEEVVAELVWDTVQLALPPLRDAVSDELTPGS